MVNSVTKNIGFSKNQTKRQNTGLELFGQNVEDMNEVAMSYLGKQAVVLESASTDKQLLNIARKLTDDERGALLKKLETAESLEEIEHIENTLKSGHV